MKRRLASIVVASLALDACGSSSPTSTPTPVPARPPVHFHRTYVGDVERGERNVSLLNIGRIAVALDLHLSQLIAEVER